ncbi:sigma-70 family RNA polymerase sigma factor [Croceicoccus marinus]|jgi:RNA polymerase sigma factor for flagellar operon FliA|uniref:Sigma-70 family RNA polymerase sigma factor n=1 Tax=Croceicoccus marinus TaxID=450378 RepID=A0A7G6VR06_9SPHN|nr:sigma-70 family RNA polymerase sigma factor [Croceicoccus marinus]QNE04171.1 sigma-70 family RNA polymerase sigma factor [Croceicoccus marinus]
MRHEHIAIAGNPRHEARRAYAGEAEHRIRAFMPMVKKLAWHAHGSGRPGIEIEDLVQVGLIALTECVRRHDGQGEHAFAAYAKTRVRGAMFDLIRREAPTTRTAARKRREIEEESRRLASQLGRIPSEGELADAMGMNAREFASVRAQSEPLRFDAIDSCYSDSNAAFADASADGLEAMEQAEQGERLAIAIADLPDRLQMITQLYFVEELNLGEIAAVLGVSIPRVHQLKAQALERLKAAMVD